MTTNIKPHVHFRGKVEYHYGGPTEIQTESEFHRKLALPHSGLILDILGDVLKELQEDMAFREVNVRYRFDKASSTEYMIIEGVDLEHINLQIRGDIFTCFCEEAEWKDRKKPKGLRKNDDRK